MYLGREEDAYNAESSSAVTTQEQSMWSTRVRPIVAETADSVSLTKRRTDAAAPKRKGEADFSGRIRVIVRCRPLQPETEPDHTQNRVSIVDDDVIVREKGLPESGRSYRFDRVLTPEADQVATFAEIAPLVDHVLDGFHATVFAYGQTGSGKTFTMDGLRYCSSKHKGMSVMVPDAEGTPTENHGVIPRVIQLLYDHARSRQGSSPNRDGPDGNEFGDTAAADVEDGVAYTFRCSYYQIYNEKITDLLRVSSASPGPDGQGQGEGALQGQAGMRSKRRQDDNGLRVRWHKGDVFKVENLFLCACNSPEEMRDVLFTGIQQKVVSGHLLNHQSSRSHCVFTIHVESRSRKNGELRSKSELSLVDLAGSEKLGLLASNPSAQLMKESIDINTSLLALGKVITALSGGRAAARVKKSVGAAAFGSPRGKGKNSTVMTAAASTVHIPYRDSKLTMLLKHALGGNSLTTMIACISPSDKYVDETTSTLLYAGRAKNIRNAPHVNEDATTRLIRQLRDEITQLKAELGYYRDMASKSLGHPDLQPHLCSRCGEKSGSSTAAEGTAALTIVSADSARETEQLADSLLAACGMLKNMMEVNAELRDSYDAVRNVQEVTERREAELNAENLALRERLSVLESIVLREDDDDGTAADTPEAVGEEEEEEEEVTASQMCGTRYSPSREAENDYAQTPASPLPPPSATTATGYPSAGGHPVRERQRTSAPTPFPAPSSSSRTSTPVRTIPLSLLRSHSGGGTREKASPVRSTRLSGMLERLEQLRQQHKASSIAGRQRTSDGDKSARYQSRKKTRKKKHQLLNKRLKEYEEQYRAPSPKHSYADYYKEPRAALSAADPHAFTMRGSTQQEKQVTVALEEMRATVSKLPASMVPEFVPASLLQPGLFGALVFGGRPEDCSSFDKKRQLRDARLRAMERRQHELYQQVHLTVLATQQEVAETTTDSARQANASPSHSLPTSRGNEGGPRKMDPAADGNFLVAGNQSAYAVPSVESKQRANSASKGSKRTSSKTMESMAMLKQYLEGER